MDDPNVRFVFDDFGIPPHTGVSFKPLVLHMTEADIVRIYCLGCPKEFPTIAAAMAHQEAGCPGKAKKRWFRDWRQRWLRTR